MALTDSLPQLSIVTSIAFFSVVLFLLYQTWIFVKPQSSTHRKLVDLPVVNLKGSDYAGARKEWERNARKHFQDGLDKYNEQGWQIYMDYGFMTVLPYKFIDQLHQTNEAQLDYYVGGTILTGNFNWVDMKPTLPMIRALKRDLFPRQVRAIPLLIEEIKNRISKDLADIGSDWTSVNVASKLYRITASATARLFVGPGLCRDERWLGTSIQHTIDLVMAGRALRNKSNLRKYWDVYVRPIPEVKRVLDAQEYACKTLVPIIQERTQKLKDDPKYKLPEDVISWVIVESQEMEHPPTPREQALQHLSPTLAGIHTETVTLINAMFDLAGHPQYINALREEIDPVFAKQKADGFSTANFTKLDSLLKESQRMHPTGYFGFIRRVTDPNGIALTDGPYLPYGTYVTSSRYSVNHDPAMFPSPEEFQPFRWYDLQKAHPENAGRYQLPGIGAMSLSFGHGRHACPGRFLAANIMKSVLAYLLANYDIKAPAEWKGKRIENVQVGDQNIPDRAAMIMMRKRK